MFQTIEDICGGFASIVSVCLLLFLQIVFGVVFFFRVLLSTLFGCFWFKLRQFGYDLCRF